MPPPPDSESGARGFARTQADRRAQATGTSEHHCSWLAGSRNLSRRFEQRLRDGRTRQAMRDRWPTGGGVGQRIRPLHDLGAAKPSWTPRSVSRNRSRPSRCPSGPPAILVRLRTRFLCRCSSSISQEQAARVLATPIRLKRSSWPPATTKCIRDERKSCRLPTRRWSLAIFWNAPATSVPSWMAHKPSWRAQREIRPWKINSRERSSKPTGSSHDLVEPRRQRRARTQACACCFIDSTHILKIGTGNQPPRRGAAQYVCDDDD